MKLIECVPNFSEGRDLAVVDSIRDRIAAVPGVSVLHVTSDAWHNRSVITFVASMDAMVAGAVAAIRAARDHIDLSHHVGVHPRIGAADVVPFIPLDGASMDDCVAIARAVGRQVGDELGIPVYLYEHAATRESRRNLAHVRRGGLDALRDAIATDPDRTPDFGPARLHPTAGAVAIGARPFLIAFNCYVGDTTQVAAAKGIARAIRESSGGIPGLKALGLEVDGQAQVSMNIVDIDRTSLLDAFSAVDRQAQARGLSVAWSEVIGLVPERAAFDVASRVLRLRDAIGTHVLERRLLASRVEQSLTQYVATVGNADAFPGGGSVAAMAGALAAALVQMVAGLTVGRKRYAAAEDEMSTTCHEARTLALSLESLAQLDAQAYAAVVDARGLPVDSGPQSDHRATVIRVALLTAARVPLQVCRDCEKVARMCEIVAARGNVNAITDSGTAAALASAASLAAAYNVRVNVRELGDAPDGSALATEAIELARSCALAAARVAELVDAALE